MLPRLNAASLLRDNRIRFAQVLTWQWFLKVNYKEDTERINRRFTVKGVQESQVWSWEREKKKHQVIHMWTLNDARGTYTLDSASGNMGRIILNGTYESCSPSAASSTKTVHLKVRTILLA